MPARSVKNTETEKQRYIADARVLIESLVGTPGAEVVVAGDPTLAQVRAENACLPAIEFLQFITGIYEHSERNIRVDFRSFEAVGFRPVLMLSEDRTHFNRNHNRFGASGALILDARRFEQLREANLIGILDILGAAAENRSEIEKLILRAVHWFADAELQRNQENQLQSYVTCLGQL